MSSTKIVSAVVTEFPWGEKIEDLELKSEKVKEYKTRSVQKIHVSSNTIGGKNVVAKFSSPGGVNTEYSYNSDGLRILGREASLYMSLDSSLNYRNLEERLQHRTSLSAPVNNNSFTVISKSKIDSSIVPYRKYDNSYISHAIPSTIYGYRWIADNSTVPQDANGNTLRPQGNLYDYKYFKGVSVDFIKSPTTTLDPVGTNSEFYEPMDLTSLTTGPETLASEGITPSLYSRYLRNKKDIIGRSRAASFWTKEQNKIVRNLVANNYVTSTDKDGLQVSSTSYKYSPVSPNNILELNFSIDNDELSASTLFSDVYANQELFSKHKSTAALRSEIIQNTNEAKEHLQASNLGVTSTTTTETIFPNRKHASVSYTRERGGYGNSELDILKRTSDVRVFWAPNPSDRQRPLGSSNSMDYKNSPYYNLSGNLVDSLHALDNLTMEDGKRLVGELAYQGKEFYPNLITNNSVSNKNLSSVSSVEYKPNVLIQTKDLLNVEITTERQLERLNIQNNLVASVDYDKEYSWGTSISPYDLHRNREYYSGAYYDKDGVRIDFLRDDSKRDYDNKSLILCSYEKTEEVLNSYELSKTTTQGILTTPLRDDSTTVVSRENLGVKKVQDSSSSFSHISSSQVNNLVYNKVSRPTLQMFYYPNEFYGLETGFKPEVKDVQPQPFYSDWRDVNKDTRSVPSFSSVLPEFNISKTLNEYQSRDNGFREKIKNLFHLPGAGASNERMSPNTSAKVQVTVESEYSLDGSGLQPLTSYPVSDNNYAWYSSRNRESMLNSDKSYRGHNNTYIPDDSTFTIENSINTNYNVSRSTGFAGLNTSGSSWYSIDPVVKRNASAKFNIDDFKKDYLITRITKFDATDENIILSPSTNSDFSVSLWFQPDNQWYDSEDEVGLFSLTNGLGIHRNYLTVFCKNSNGKISLSTNAGSTGQTAETNASYSVGKINSLILTHTSNILTLYLNGVDITSGGITFSDLGSMSFINRLILGLSYKNDNDEVKYRGVLDEVLMYKGVLSAADIVKIVSGGQPNNVMELKANSELSSPVVPILYNRIGYPSCEKIKEFTESHDAEFFDRFILGGSTNISMVSDIANLQGLEVSLDGVIKLLPYNGLYPYQRVLQMGALFDKTYRVSTLMHSQNALNYSQKLQSLYQPFMSPGVLFNSLRAGIECPWPLYTNATGLEPTKPYSTVEVFRESSGNQGSIEKTYDNIAPSWYYNESFQCENREFLPHRPETVREIKNTRSWKELKASQPKFLNNLNDNCGLVINRVANSKLSLEALRDESFYENIKKKEQETLERVKTYQYCVLEFIPEEIEENSGFSLYSTGKRDNINITFRKAENLEKTGKKYSINKATDTHDAQIEIESYEFTPKNIEKSVCELFNLHMSEGEYRVIPLDRADESTPKPESHVLNNVNLNEIDQRLDTSGNDRVRLALVYIGKVIDEDNIDVTSRSFVEYREAVVSTFSGDKSEKLGIKYRDRNNAPDRGVDLTKMPYGQYDREFYSGTERVVSLISSQAVDSKGVVRKEEQVYLLAGDHYSGNVLSLGEKQVWPSFNWKPNSPDNSFQKSVANFLEGTQEFFLKHDETLRFTSTDSTFTTQPGMTYSMEVYLRKTDNFSVVKSRGKNEGKYSGPPYRFQDPKLYRREEEINDDLAFAPFAPAYHYGEVVAKVEFVAENKTTTVHELLDNLKVTNINDSMIEEYKKRFAHNGQSGLESFLESPAYKGKNNIDSCVNLFTTNADGQWQISLKSEFPILNYDDSTPTSETPVGFWNNYGKLPSANEGVYFGIRETVNSELGSKEGSLIKLCKFQDPQKSSMVETKSENRVGEFAESKKVSEAVLVIPYCDTEYTKLTEPYALTKKMFTINAQESTKSLYFFTTDREDFDEAVVSDSRASNSYSKMKKRLENYIMPPELDFVQNNDIEPFACYVLEASVELNATDLANIWQGRLPEKSTSWSVVDNPESTFSHVTGPDEFFHDKKLPEGTRFMVFKLKQKTKNQPKDSYTYNWPYDYFSVLEKAKINFNSYSPSGGQ